jgi:hypothetical protein
MLCDFDKGSLDYLVYAALLPIPLDRRKVLVVGDEMKYKDHDEYCAA